MDPAAILQNIYRCYREKRLADIVDLLSDDFRFHAHLPEDGDGDGRPRSRAEIALMVHKFMDQYDILAFDPGPIIVTNNIASAQAEAKFRHKKSGKVLETRFFHDCASPTARRLSLGSATIRSSSGLSSPASTMAPPSAIPRP